MASVKLVNNKGTVKSFWKKFSQYSLQSLAVVLLVLSTSPANANETDEMFCSHAGATRVIFIQTENAQSAVPCDVVENKRIDSPDSATSLWSAGDDAGYCKRKLVGYVEKLRGLGFECWPTVDSESTQVPVIINPAR